MMFKKIAILISAIMLTSAFSYSQDYKIKGLIVEAKTGEPLIAATVTLHRLKDSTLVKGEKTKGDGLFTFENLQKGAYYVRVSSIGYKVWFSDRLLLGRGENATDLGKIEMEDSAIVSDEVKITAERRQVEYEVDKKVFYIEKSVITSGGNAIDALKTIPMVEIDANNRIKVRGTTKVQVQIDGKGAGGGRGPGGGGGTRMLENIPAEMIEKIEVITNPSAKNDPDGISGILNIVLDQNKIRGLNIMAGGHAGFNDKYRFMTGIRYGQGKFNLFANYFGGSSWNFGESESSQTSWRQGDTVRTEREGTSRNYGLNHNFRSRLSYNITPMEQIVGEANFGFSKSEGQNLSDYLTQKTGASGASEYFERNKTNSESPGTNFETSLKYDKKWDMFGKQKLSADVSYSNFYMTNDADYDRSQYTLDRSSLLGEYVTRTATDNKFDNFMFQTDYVTPLSSDSKFETGYKGIIRSDDKEYSLDSSINNAWVENRAAWNKYRYDESIHAVYASVSFSIINMNFMTGLRAEQALTTLDQKSMKKEFDNDYFSLFPTVHAVYNFNEEDKLQASYSRRINRPSIEQLNPFVDYSDPMEISSGNPDLKPEYTNAFEMNMLKYFGKVMILPQLFYRKTTDNISSFRELLPGGVVNNTFRNMASSSSYGFEFTVSTPVWNWWKVGADFSYYMLKIEGNQYSNNVTNEDYSWNFNFNSMMNLTDDVDFQFNTRYKSPMVTAQGKTYETFSVDMGVKVQLIQDVLTLNLRGNNIFNTMTRRSETTTDYMYGTSKSYPEYPSGMIGLQFRFSSGMNTGAAKSKRETEDLLN